MITPPTIDQPSYFDRLAQVEAAHWWSRGMWRLAAHWLNGALRARTGLTALDVGCGTGLTAVRLADLAAISAVVGLEPSPAALTLARRHGVPLVRGSAVELPFASQSFDVITCFDVFQHLPLGGDERAAREIRRVLRPGGVAVIRANAQVGEARRPAGAICYRLAELVRLLEAADLSVRRASHANCLPALAQELRGRLARGRPGASPGHPAGGGLRIQPPHPLVNRLMEQVSSIEAAFAGRLPARLPFGHSTMVLVIRMD